MNYHPNEISSIDARLKEAGISIEAFCARVGIHSTSWQRWRHRAAGDLTKPSPTVATWDRVNAALDAVLNEDGQGEALAAKGAAA